jgi:hypothetical protein
MFRRTDRLRNVFKEKGYLAPTANSEGCLNEAEFTLSRHAAKRARNAWRTDIDFGAVLACYHPAKTTVTVCKSTGAVFGPVGVGHVRKIDVLWLSPTEFISAMALVTTSPSGYAKRLFHASTLVVVPRSHRNFSDFERTETQALDTLLDSEDWISVNFNVYSVSTFDSLEHGLLRDESLQFLNHVLSPLPVGYFCHMRLQVFDAKFSPAQYTFLLSLIPPDAAQWHRGADDLRTKRCRIQTLTDVTLEGIYNTAQLLAVMSHNYNPHIQMSFTGFDTISRDEINEALLQSKQLRQVHVPSLLAYYSEDGDVDTSFSTNECIESLHLRVENEDPSWSLLLGIVDNRRIQQLTVTHKIEWSDSEHTMPEMLFDGLFVHVLPEHASLKEVHVNVKIEADDSSDPFDDINEFFRWQLDWFDTHPTMFHNVGVGSLLFLNVGACVDGYVGDGEFIHHTWNMKANKWWDNFITPGLSLNWYRDHEEHASHWSVTPSGASSGENKTANALLTQIVRAINFDILYSKTTNQLPFDTRTANASVICHLVQRKLSQRESRAYGSA